MSSTLFGINTSGITNTVSNAANTLKGAATSVSEKALNLSETLQNNFKEFTKFDDGSTQNGSLRDVVRDYMWTLSNVESFLEEIPYISLKEFKCNESSIKKQLNLYTNITRDTFDNIKGGFKAGASKTNVGTEVYADIWPKNQHTGNLYILPYFNQTAFELKTQAWQSLDSIGESLTKIADNLGPLGALMKAGGELANAIADTALNVKYPSVGVMDRPKLFTGHENRQITVSFPLYNTFNVTDWEWNLDLIYTLMTQNLFYKRDYITGVPPVFYEVSVPGSYYCYAAAMTDIRVDNLGNVRRIGKDTVPDAYQVTLTLSELVMPSKNQFEEAKSGYAGSVVKSYLVF